MAAYHTCVVTSGGDMLSGHPSVAAVPDSTVMLAHLVNIEAAGGCFETDLERSKLCGREAP